MGRIYGVGGGFSFVVIDYVAVCVYDDSRVEAALNRGVRCLSRMG